MKIQMLKLACGPTGNYESGRTYDVPSELGLAFIDAEAARDVTPPEPKRVIEPVTAAPVPEQAVKVAQAKAENTMGRGAKRKK